MHIFLGTCRPGMYQDEHVLFFELYDAHGANITAHIYIHMPILDGSFTCDDVFICYANV